MSYAELRAFHSVALHSSFTRAANALHVTQPTLSGQVKALEEAHGVKLLDRRGREVAPTELGRVLLDITRRLFALESEATQLLAAARGLIRGNLRVAADAPYHVIPLLAAFNRRHPGIRLALSFGNSERVLKDLFERRTDVAVLPNVAADPRLEALPLRRDRLVVFVERGHPWWRRRSIRLGELAEQRLILREPGSTTRAIIEEAMTRAGIAPAEVFEIGSREAVREAVAAGLGVGVVFESEFGRDDRLHKLAVRDTRLSAVEYVVCLKDPGQTRVVRAFLDLMQEGGVTGL
jgi:aminoethylphosphonate catabolism LysR family transcriptional regulator